MNELNFYKQEKIKYDQLISTTTDEFLKSKLTGITLLIGVGIAIYLPPCKYFLFNTL